MEQRVSTNSFKKEFRRYVNSRSEKPLKDIRKLTSKADLRPVLFWGSIE